MHNENQQRQQLTAEESSARQDSWGIKAPRTPSTLYFSESLYFSGSVCQGMVNDREQHSLENTEEPRGHRRWPDHSFPTDGPQLHLGVVHSPEGQLGALQPRLDHLQGTGKDGPNRSSTPAKKIHRHSVTNCGTGVQSSTEIHSEHSSPAVPHCTSP